MNTAKKYCAVLVSVLALSLVCGGLSYTMAAPAPTVYGTYNITLNNKVWLSGEGTDSNTTYGTCVIKENKTWKVTEYGIDGKTRNYSGQWRWNSGGKYIRVRELKSLRSAIEKKSLVPWLKNYIRYEFGESITGIKFKYSKYDVTRIRVYDLRLGSFKIILKGTVSGYVDGQYHSRSFKYQTKITFNTMMD